MKSGKILLMVFIVLASAIGIAALQELDSDGNGSVIHDDFSSKVKTIKVALSDGVGSKLSGTR